jgi:hypothetical protein
MSDKDQLEKIIESLGAAPRKGILEYVKDWIAPLTLLLGVLTYFIAINKDLEYYKNRQEESRVEIKSRVIYVDNRLANIEAKLNLCEAASARLTIEIAHTRKDLQRVESTLAK